MTFNQFKQVIRFGLWGLPGFITGILLNLLFVELIQLNVYISYVYVLIILTLVNFFIVDRIVFKSKEKKNNSKKRFMHFTGITLSSRGLEWLSYSALIYFFNFFYIFVQIGVSIIFVFFKYFVLREVMR